MAPPARCRSCTPSRCHAAAAGLARREGCRQAFRTAAALEAAAAHAQALAQRHGLRVEVQDDRMKGSTPFVDPAPYAPQRLG